MNTRCIGIVGEKGSGKGAFGEIVKKLLPSKRVEIFSTSKPIRDVLTILDKELSRENFDIIATAVRNGFHDEGVWTPAARKLLRSIEVDVVTVDGIRKQEEVQMIRDLKGVLLYITADQRVRHERRRLAVEKSDEMNIDLQMFAAQDLLPSNKDIPQIGKTADYVIENNGTLEEFEEKIEKFLIQQKLM